MRNREPLERKAEHISKSKYATYIDADKIDYDFEGVPFMTDMQPMPGKIIVKQDGHATKSPLVFSDKFKEKDRPMTGRVLAVGEGKLRRLDEASIYKLAEIAIGEIEKLPVHMRPTKTSLVAATVKNALDFEQEARPVSVKVGDRVVFRVFAGDGIEWPDGSMCRCVTEEDLLAVIVD